MSFNNQSITPVRKDKPHLVLRDRFWRVSPKPRPYHKYEWAWGNAHRWANLANWELMK